MLSWANPNKLIGVTTFLRGQKAVSLPTTTRLPPSQFPNQPHHLSLKKSVFVSRFSFLLAAHLGSLFIFKLLARFTTNMSDNSDQKSNSSPSSTTPKLMLYSFWQSSCAWRVRFALNLKGLSYGYRSINLQKGEQFSPEFEKLNSLHYVPVVVDGDVVVSDSFAILLYLEEKYPGKALLPVDPQLRAINLQAASIINSSIQPLHMMAVLKCIEEKLGPKERSYWAEFHIEKGFLALEKLLNNFAAKYATGNEVYLADVFLAPQIAVATKRFNIDMSKFPTLSKLFNSYMALPEFQASLPQRQPDAES